MNSTSGSGTTSGNIRALLCSVALGQLVSFMDTLSSLFVKLLASQSNTQFPLLQYVITYFVVCLLAFIPIIAGTKANPFRRHHHLAASSNHFRQSSSEANDSQNSGHLIEINSAMSRSEDHLHEAESQHTSMGMVSFDNFYSFKEGPQTSAHLIGTCVQTAVPPPTSQIAPPQSSNSCKSDASTIASDATSSARQSSWEISECREMTPSPTQSPCLSSLWACEIGEGVTCQSPEKECLVEALSRRDAPLQESWGDAPSGRKTENSFTSTATNVRYDLINEAASKDLHGAHRPSRSSMKVICCSTKNVSIGTSMNVSSGQNKIESASLLSTSADFTEADDPGVLSFCPQKIYNNKGLSFMTRASQTPSCSINATIPERHDPPGDLSSPQSLQPSTFPSSTFSCDQSSNSIVSIYGSKFSCSRIQEPLHGISMSPQMSDSPKNCSLLNFPLSKERLMCLQMGSAEAGMTDDTNKSENIFLRPQRSSLLLPQPTYKESLWSECSEKSSSSQKEKSNRYCAPDDVTESGRLLQLSSKEEMPLFAEAPVTVECQVGKNEQQDPKNIPKQLRLSWEGEAIDNDNEMHHNTQSARCLTLEGSQLPKRHKKNYSILNDGADYLKRQQFKLSTWLWSLFAVGTPAFYILIAFLDVQGGTLSVMAFSYTNLASCCLIDWVSLLTAFILSVKFLGERATKSRIIALLVGLIGSLCILISDSRTDEAGLFTPFQPPDNPIIIPPMLLPTETRLAAAAAAAANDKHNDFQNTNNTPFMQSKILQDMSPVVLKPNVVVAAAASHPSSEYIDMNSSRILLLLQKLEEANATSSTTTTKTTLRGKEDLLLHRDGPVRRILSEGEQTSKADQLFGDVLCLLAAFFLGIVTVMMEKALLSGIPATEVLLKTFFPAFIIVLIEFLLLESHKISRLASMSFLSWIYLCLAALTMAGAYGLAPIVLERSSSSFFNLSLLTSAALAVIFSALLLGDHFPPLYSVGLIAILGSLIIYHYDTKIMSGS